jgi:hypothetical protein
MRTHTLHRASAAGAKHSVVLFQREGCSFSFATATERQLTGVLNLTTADSIQITRQTEDFIRLQCHEWHIKRHVLGWDTRSTAAKRFCIAIK